MDKPLVSIIITTRNSEATIEALLQSISNQTYRNFEVIVVDNQSSDRTKLISKRFTPLVFNRGPERSAQRNFGAKKAVGDYYFFLDSDMVLTPNVVKKCIEKTTNYKKNSNLGGIVVPEKSFGVGLWTKAKILEREINKGEAFFESARFFNKQIFWEFGGYDTTITGPEDWDLPQRIRRKYQIIRAGSVIMHNEQELSVVTLFRKKYYYGLSAHRYLQKHKLPIIGQQTVYFLRPAFYKRWRELLRDPLITMSMFVRLFVELLGGGLGYLSGRFKNEEF